VGSGYSVGFIGPKDKENTVIDLLRAYGIENHKASVYRHMQHTGYPGLNIPYTYVDLNTDDEKTKTELVGILSKLGFENRQIIENDFSEGGDLHSIPTKKQI
jgi:hypothetical protein